MKISVVIRFVIIGALWLLLCVWFVARQRAAGIDLNFMTTIFPLAASGIIVFVPLYKKYVRNDGKKGNN